MSDGSTYLRVTLLGGARNADLVLPAQEPVALLVPRILDVVGIPDTTASYTLARLDGHVIEGATALAENDLRDGDVLRLVAEAEAPAAPLVYDVVEVVDLMRPRGMWDDRVRQAVLSALASVLLVVTSWLVTLVRPESDFTVWVGTAVLAAALSAGAAWTRRTSTSWAFAASTLVATGLAVWTLDGPWTRWGRVGVATLVLAVVVGVVGWCLRAATPTLIALAGVALFATEAFLLGLVVDDPARIAAVVAATAVLVVGLLPRIALESSGVFALDTAVTSGVQVSRRDAAAGAADAHGVLLGGALVCALVLASSLSILAVGRPDVWGVTTCVALTLATALRARHFPLGLERFALWAAAGSGLVGLVRAAIGARGDLAPALLIVPYAGVAALVLLAHASPSDLRGAQFRRTASALETVALLSTVPLLVGLFGVYGDLLATFS